MNKIIVVIVAGVWVAGMIGVPAASAEEAKGGVISGKAVFKGEPPARQKIDTASDPNCCKDHPEPFTEDVMVDKDKNLKNVMVYVKSGLAEGKEYAAAKEPVVMDQVGCVFSPHVVGLMVGQELKVTNSDATLHNVHGLPRKGAEFNLVQNKKGSFNSFTFKEPEVPGFLIKCDVHAWMKSYVWVFAHPFFAVTKDDGTFTLPELPPGEYTIEAWQEKCGKQQQKVKVEAGKKAEVNWTFEMKKKG